MPAIERYQYKLAFELRIRRAYGTAFQDFFSTVLEKLHGADFIRVRAFGSLGDKGCDGYRSSNGQVFQCFGKLEDAAVNAAGLVKKIGDDYALADTHLNSIMKEWHFGHNLVDGLPITAVQKIEALKVSAPQHVIGVMGPAWLETQIFGLSALDLADLLGPAATSEDSRNLQIEEVRQVVDALMSTLAADDVTSDDIHPVPSDKLAFNKLPVHWVQLITAASQNGPYLRQYFERHPQVEAGARVAAEFAARYRALKQEMLDPGTIMDRLYEQLTGVGAVSAARQVASQSLLAYLFDACEIFEDHPSKVSA